MTTELTIRKAHLDDLDAVEAIEWSVFDSDQLSRASLRRYMSVPSTAMVVAQERADITGYALVGFRKGSKIGRLYSIAVDKARAGRGVGRALLDASETAAHERGCTRFALEVRADNPRAIALYEKNGYEMLGREDEWYEDGGAALRFEKKLVD
ncbi:MAG: GCN5-related N-acetyltransferase [Hyphomicrobiales bacterium]|nr:GCN5-related N-acetyltransferase [Hyphomicrobiales bacterium]